MRDTAPGKLLEHQHSLEPPHVGAAEFRPGIDAAETKRAQSLQRRSVEPPIAVPVLCVRTQALGGDSRGGVDHQPLLVAQGEQPPGGILRCVIRGHVAARLACNACAACPAPT